MQGFIIRTQKVKDEDLIVYILTRQYLVKSYRFYGARHSSVMTGYKIDFELIENTNFLPQLKNVMHLGYKWLIDRDRLIIWQQLMRLLYEHLKDVDSIDEIYFNELDLCAKCFELANPKRLIIESYIKILEFEGRLHSELECFVCDEPIYDIVSLTRGFLPSHPHCLNKSKFYRTKIENLFDTKSTIELDDDDINTLYKIILDGF
ncbi:recombination protein RecO [Campylobacter sp. faydin G-24]|uniref:Recombination protein RecO n=1 Tax=Campylobacter anatolicus TaxID=2829105 RepID=A0ABS5HJG9_9BACT|nr:recombination protein RecO [Campylobacter anatolicus]MBR8461896.1 recombination protein RecO [Campylobacter anatolicus]MBR8464293.1 recombination protein RecO [Campylobacter anatolicus]MBR8465013.1 recombination protein RecO [Campylobacter anatolicus]